jgi:dTDP-4-dehydrorhamnose 3,5-epimerase
MHTTPTGIDGFELLHSQVHQDERGHFIEAFHREQLATLTGFDFQTAQFNSSLSKAGVLRGFHYKLTPPGQAKFVTVVSGAIYDVALDLRVDSPTYRQWRGVELAAGSGQSVLLVAGLAHAFLALAPNTVIGYLNDTPFQPELEFAINPLSVDVPWREIADRHEVGELLISERDRAAPAASEVWAGSDANPLTSGQSDTH